MQEIADRSRTKAGLPLDVSVRPLGATAWESDSRIIPGAGWIALRLVRTIADGDRVITNLCGLEDRTRASLLEWAVARARGLGADGIGLWVDRGNGGWLAAYGFRPVRPFWRMDRPDLDGIPAPSFPEGYRMIDGVEAGFPLSTWVEALNSSFADHWRYAPEDPASPRAGLAETDRRLHLMALAPTGDPAAVVVSSLMATADGRPQPVGHVQQVGTLPAHRRRGLGTALTSAALRRLRDAGAASASLNVDAQNPARAYDLYRSLGFEVAREYDVWSLDLATPH